MNEKPIGKEMFIKYLQFLIDSANKLLSSGIIEYEFENIMREYARFLYRVISSNKIDDKLKKDLVAYDLFNKWDLENYNSPFTEGFFYELPFFKQLSNVTTKIKLDKIKRMLECLSHIQFKIEGYIFK
jgi:hypothetical protein